MKGLELARAYYERCGKKMIRDGFAAYEDCIAVGLVGQGSECFGFDDAISRDHDFGPAFCMWLTPETWEAIGVPLQSAYAALPSTFMGFPARVPGEHSEGRIGVLVIDEFYRQQIGRPDADLTPMQWLYVPEWRLATVTNGEVFADPLGRFSGIRAALSRFYPEDVRLKKIAARAVAMAQSGQYNYARCMRRGESVAARAALDAFVRSAASMVFLLNRRYMPFYKWMHRAMRDLPVLREAGDLLTELSVAPLSRAAWDGAAEPVNMRDPQVALIERLCRLVKKQLQHDGITDNDSDFLADHAAGISERITDGRIRSLHIMEG